MAMIDEECRRALDAMALGSGELERNGTRGACAIGRPRLGAAGGRVDCRVAVVGQDCAHHSSFLSVSGLGVWNGKRKPRARSDCSWMDPRLVRLVA